MRWLVTRLAAVAVFAASAAFAAPTMVTPGKFSVSATGAATYAVPVSVPPGTAGLAPNLALAYSSENGDGLVGIGWSLSGLSSITRCPRTLAQDGIHGSVNYDSNDRFCLDGQRLMVISGTYGADGSEYRTEIESFTKVIAHGTAGSGPAWFEAWTKSGQHLEFGHTTDSQVLVVSATSGVTSTARLWAVNKVSDAAGNYLAATYNCAASGSSCTDTDRTVNGEVYPLRVDYTGNSNAGTNPYNSVQFNYASRSDTSPQYQAGGVVTTTVVLTDIKTYQAANLVTDYRLAYRAGTSIQHSRLISLTQCDAMSGGNCLPSLTFGWQGGDAALSFSSTTSTTTANKNVVAGDWNGDGLTDQALVSYVYPTCPPYPVYLGQPGFSFAPSSYVLTNGAATSGANLCVQHGPLGTVTAPDGTADILLTLDAQNTVGPPPSPNIFTTIVTTTGAVDVASYTGGLGGNFAGDYNGDGIVDFLSGSSSLIAYLGNTSGGFAPDAGHSFNSYSVGDFDGDGCTDVVSQVGSTSTINFFCNPAVSSVTVPNVGASSVSGDFNGDGKVDFLQTNPTTSGHLLLSTGTGFVDVNSGIPSGWNVVGTGDWNGDGKADLLVETSSGSDYQVFLSTGTGFTPALDSSGNPIIITNSANGGITVADWNSDGAADFLVQTTSYGDWYEAPGYTPELMTAVSNGVGATTTISYDRINKNGPFYTKGSSSTYPSQDVDGAQYVVKEVDTSNGLGTCTPPSTTNCYRTTYAYAGAVRDLQGRGFLGYSQVVATDLQTNTVQTTNYSVAFPYIGLVTSQTSVNSGTGATLSSITNTYTNNSGCGITPAGSGVYVDCLAQTVLTRHDLNGATLPSSTTTYTYDQYGNALTTNVSVSDGSSKNTTNTYNNDTTHWFLGQLLTTQVHSTVGSSDIVRQSSFAYDAATGLLTQESIEPGVSTCNNGSSSCTVTTAYTLDAFGNRVTTTVYGTGITTRTSYAFFDGNGQFQTSAANALGQYEFWTYNPAFGLPASHTGPNGLTTSWAYDTFGRPTLEVRPDGTRTTQSYSYCSGGCPANGQFYSQSEAFSPGGGTQIGPVSTSYFDMLSRDIADDTQGFDGSNIRTATAYDANGRVQETSRPYFTASASPAWTQYIYDDLGRVTQKTFPDTTQTTYSYNGLVTSQTNALTQTTTTTWNAQGLRAAVQDASSHTTSYVYAAFGDLLTATDPAGNVTAANYDVRGNRVSANSPDLGNWTYSYDVLAELTGQIDAKAQSSSVSYDVLGRPLSRTEPQLYSAWTYGTSSASHNVGQLIEAQACTAPGCATLVSDRTYSFDGLGRQTTSILHTPTDYFGYGTTYNSTNGQIASVTYPSGFGVHRNYNAYGYLTSLDDGHSPIWTASARDAEQHLTSQIAGNGVTTTQAFSALTGVIQNQRAGPGGAVASFDYSFNAIGNLTSRTDNNQSFTERFCYDSLNRLTNYNIGAACTGGATVSYDSIGNITAKSDAGTYSYGASGPHQVSSITGTVDGLTNPKYSYDATGNLTCVSSGSGCSGTIARTVVPTSFNMTAGLTQGSASLNLTYDDQHQRIRQYLTSGSTAVETVYMNDAASGTMSERVTTGPSTITNWNSFNWGAAPWSGTLPTATPTFVDYITVDGQIVAQRKVQYPSASAWGQYNWAAFNWGPPPGSNWGGFNWGSGTWTGPAVTWAYFAVDSLGSVAATTDQGGNVTAHLSYDAWGKQRNPNGTAAACGSIASPTTRGFTNQEQVPAGCLVNLNARLYDPSIGKFMAADTMVPETYDGQSFNRYSYVTNNPLTMIDPTGHGDFWDKLKSLFGYPPGYSGPSPASDGTDTGPSNPVVDPTKPESVVVTGDRIIKSAPLRPTIIQAIAVPVNWFINLFTPGGHAPPSATPSPQDGPVSQPANGKNRNPNQINCGSLLPNGRTVGSYVNQLSNDINSSAGDPVSTPYGPVPNPNAPGPLSVARAVYSGTNFRGMFGTGAGYNMNAFLGDAGNFAYGAVSRNIGVPLLVTEMVAGGYSVTHHPSSDWVGPWDMDPSATTQVPAGYGASCKVP